MTCILLGNALDVLVQKSANGIITLENFEKLYYSRRVIPELDGEPLVFEPSTGRIVRRWRADALSWRIEPLSWWEHCIARTATSPESEWLSARIVLQNGRYSIVCV